MVKTITLDPFDIYNLTVNLKMSFEELLSEAIELDINEGIILPNLKMSADNDRCFFLTDEGRCSIHGFRPGLCRLFPLGRFFEDRSVHYILQIHECKAVNRTDITVHKWIGLPDIAVYEDFSAEWYYLQKKLQKYIAGNINQAKVVNMQLLKIFYLSPYDGSDFFGQFKERKSLLEKSLFAE